MEFCNSVGMQEITTEYERSSGEEIEKPKSNQIQIDGFSQKGDQLFNNDTVKLEQTIPEMVWRLVLGKLKNDDLENCANSSPFFWELTGKDRTLHLFPKVIQIMTSLFERQKLQIRLRNQNEEDVSIARLIDQDIKQIAKKVNLAVKLWRSTVFNCRLVCSVWNRAVEKCYEGAEMTEIAEFATDYNPESTVNLMNIELFRQKFTFSNLNQKCKPKQFLEYFYESHGSPVSSSYKNPIFGRSVFINIYFLNLVKESRYHDDCFNVLFNILELFGGEIWYCELKISPKQAISHLGRILSLMPNLKYLKLSSDSRCRPREEYMPNELPTLEKLQVLTLVSSEYPLTAELIRRYGHVKYLTFDCCEVPEDVGSFLTNLKGYTTTNSFRGDGILARFGNEWKLEVIKITPRYDQTAAQLFTLLQNNWADTLIDVTLNHPFSRDEDKIYEQSKHCRLSLPFVRRFSVLSDHVFFLDFLEPLNKNFKHLEILPASCYKGAKYWNRVECEQKIEWIGYQEKMNRSNIWNIFGKLKTINIVFIHWRTKIRKEIIFTKDREKFVYLEKQKF